MNIYNSKFILTGERERDANALQLYINRLIKDNRFTSKAVPRDAWKCLICSFFHNAFSYGLIEKRYDVAYHKSLFKILEKRVCFITHKINKKQYYEWLKY